MDSQFQETSAIVNAKGKEYSPPVSLSYLPDDIMLNCLARISRLYYPNLSLVSKRFRSLLASTELYETRRLLGSTERCAFFYINSFGSSQPHWFTLIHGQTRIPKCNARWFPSGYSPCRNRTTKNLMVSVPSQNVSPPRCQCRTTTIGFNIYMFGNYIKGGSSKVLVLDCRSNTWHEAPRMRMAPKSPLACAVDGKIYVVEGSGDCDPNPSDFMECFDPKTQIWEHVPCPGAEIRGACVSESFSHEGINLYLVGNKNVVYKPKENKWYVVKSGMDLGGSSESSCMIDDVKYRCTGGSRYNKNIRRLVWYSKESSSWKAVKNVYELPFANVTNSVSLKNYGGNIAVFWEQHSSTKIGINEKEIWCAEIEITKRDKEDVYGKVEWRDAILTVHRSCYLDKFIVATV